MTEKNRIVLSYHKERIGFNFGCTFVFSYHRGKTF